MGLQFKPELAEKIMAGKKTQTRRPFKQGDSLVNGRLMRLTKSGKTRTQWQEGHVYAVQPGRSKKGIGLIKLTAMEFIDARHISHEDALAEGFTSRLEFLKVWAGFYDKAVTLEKLADGRWSLIINQRDTTLKQKLWGMKVKVAGVCVEVTASETVILGQLKLRPNDLYQGWALTFHVVEEVQS